ncbi:hypothetical protein CEXT_431241 [Caerostris extrusa]|uniref:Uncharacterized protein n=1 Tax=Caerostris extrusa TaxID=172846 RepID=A0AAV4UHT5_CAEEX|nr:hypothetical protein CEXT_431241 [Caerostris extrusa]
MIFDEPNKICVPYSLLLNESTWYLWCCRPMHRPWLQRSEHDTLRRSTAEIIRLRLGLQFRTFRSPTNLHATAEIEIEASKDNDVSTQPTVG